MRLLHKFKVPERDIAKMSEAERKGLASLLVVRAKQGLCTYGQASVLRRAGYSKAELHDMTRQAASEAIEAVRANNWRRPEVEA
jgi:hypothetical protein